MDLTQEFHAGKLVDVLFLCDLDHLGIDEGYRMAELAICQLHRGAGKNRAAGRDRCIGDYVFNPIWDECQKRVAWAKAAGVECLCEGEGACVQLGEAEPVGSVEQELAAAVLGGCLLNQ